MGLVDAFGPGGRRVESCDGQWQNDADLVRYATDREMPARLVRGEASNDEARRYLGAAVRATPFVVRGHQGHRRIVLAASLATRPGSRRMTVGTVRRRRTGTPGNRRARRGNAARGSARSGDSGDGDQPGAASEHPARREARRGGA